MTGPGEHRTGTCTVALLQSPFDRVSRFFFEDGWDGMDGWMIDHFFWGSYPFYLLRYFLHCVRLSSLFTLTGLPFFF